VALTATMPEVTTADELVEATSTGTADVRKSRRRNKKVIESTGQTYRNKDTWVRSLRKNWQIYTFTVIPVAFLLLFRYGPMIGNVIAFRRFRPGSHFLGDEWVGLHFFRMAVNNPQFWQAFWNSLILGGTWSIIGFPLPIILALMLNELRYRKFKRTVQTISYMPHFLSIVIVVGLIREVVAGDGMLNNVLNLFGIEGQIWLQNAAAFRPIWIISEAWQTVGWGTILYLAALSTIDDGLYEAARIDGANRWQQTWHVTLPGIMPTMVVLMTLNIGSFMAVGFEKVLLLQSPLIFSTGDVISTFVFRVGISQANFSFGTAVGLMEAVIGLVLVMSSNFAARKLVGTSLW
jgi:putative aldouronate transport system permease protein